MCVYAYVGIYIYIYIYAYISVGALLTAAASVPMCQHIHDICCTDAGYVYTPAPCLSHDFCSIRPYAQMTSGGFTVRLYVRARALTPVQDKQARQCRQLQLQHGPATFECSSCLGSIQNIVNKEPKQTQKTSKNYVGGSRQLQLQIGSPLSAAA